MSEQKNGDGGHYRCRGRGGNHGDRGRRGRGGQIRGRGDQIRGRGKKGRNSKDSHRPMRLSLYQKEYIDQCNQMLSYVNEDKKYCYLSSNKEKVNLNREMVNCINLTKISYDVAAPAKKKFDPKKCEIKISSLSTIGCARDMHKKGFKKIAVMSFASPFKPGGFYKSGFFSQEASIVSQTLLFGSLLSSSAQPYYCKKENASKYDFYNNGLIFSPQVPVIANGESRLKEAKENNDNDEYRLKEKFNLYGPDEIFYIDVISVSPVSPALFKRLKSNRGFHPRDRNGCHGRQQKNYDQDNKKYKHDDKKRGHDDDHDDKKYKRDYKKYGHDDDRDDKKYKRDDKKYGHNDDHDDKKYKRDDKKYGHDDDHDDKKYKRDDKKYGNDDDHDDKKYKRDDKKYGNDDDHDDKKYKRDDKKYGHNDDHDDKKYKRDDKKYGNDDDHDDKKYKRDDKKYKHDDDRDDKKYKRDEKRQGGNNNHGDRKKQDHNDELMNKIKSSMENKIRSTIYIASTNADALVLGAFGCGRSAIHPGVISGIFKKVLIDEGYGAYFKRIDFAIPENVKLIHNFKKNLDTQKSDDDSGDDDDSEEDENADNEEEDEGEEEEEEDIDEVDENIEKDKESDSGHKDDESDKDNKNSEDDE